MDTSLGGTLTGSGIQNTLTIGDVSKVCDSDLATQ
jgi:hypothetical protein